MRKSKAEKAKYEILKSIPHKRVSYEHADNIEIFDLYQLGHFAIDNAKTPVIENLELVELQPKSSYQAHYHKESLAIIYIILGQGKFKLGQHNIDYRPGMRIEIPAGTLHGFHTMERTLFLSIQSPPIIDAESQEIDIHFNKE